MLLLTKSHMSQLVSWSSCIQRWRWWKTPLARVSEVPLLAFTLGELLILLPMVLLYIRDPLGGVSYHIFEALSLNSSSVAMEMFVVKELM